MPLTVPTGRPALPGRSVHTCGLVPPAVGLMVVVLALGVSCGKKGPPLAPFSSAPAVPTEVTVRRKGDQVEIRFRVPLINSDGRKPARIDQVEVYALTMPASKGREPGRSADFGAAGRGGAGMPGRGESGPPFKKHGTVVASVVVREPPPPPPEVKEGEPPPPPPPPRTDPGLDQGDPVLVIDILTPDSLTPVTLTESDREAKREQEALKKHPPRELKLSPPEFGPSLATPPMRYYAVRGLHGGTKGVQSPATAVPIDDPPPAPPAPKVTVAEGHIVVKWVAPDGLRRPVLPLAPSQIAVPTPAATSPDASAAAARPTEEEPENAAPAAPAAPVAPVAPAGPPAPLRATLLTPFPTTIYTYAVYEMAPSGFTPPAEQPGAVPPYPHLLTPAPVSAVMWSDSRFEVGVERCYAVRTVATTGTIIVESGPSPVVCVKTEDTFPPAAPKNVQAVASEGTVSLIWDANTEADLAGYLVLRGRAGSDKLTAVTPAPIKETTFRDTTVKAGVRYSYVIVAVDTATPQNVSPQSNRVEETAR